VEMQMAHGLTAGRATRVQYDNTGGIKRRRHGLSHSLDKTHGGGQVRGLRVKDSDAMAPGYDKGVPRGKC
jgi:ribosomal protein L35